jgi:hypothetical protein
MDARAMVMAPRNRLAVAAMLAALAVAGQAAATAPVGAAGADPSSLAHRANMASSGGLAIVQIAVADPNGLVADWRKQTPGVQVHMTEATVRHKALYTFIIFKGCKADASGNCNLTADYEVIGPDGKLFSKQTDVSVWVARPAPSEAALQLSTGALGLLIEDKDLLGAYLIKTTTTDHIAGVSLATEETLTVNAN